jgi:hypothetical protein
MRKSTLLTFAAGMMAGWWAARRLPEARPAFERPVEAPPEHPIEVTASPGNPPAESPAAAPAGEAPAPVLPPSDAPPELASETAMRDARSTIDARVRNLRRSRRSR